MLLKDHIQELADRLGTETLDEKTKAIYTRKINESYKEIARIFDWEHLRNTGELLTVANVTGTATIILGSHIVTGVGTSFTESMTGRFFQPSTGSNWYRISSVQSTTSLTLQTAVAEASGSVTFTIWKRFYYLPSRVRKISLFNKWISPEEIQGRSQDYLQDGTNFIATTGEPTDFAPYGSDEFPTIYSTGTVTLSLDSLTVLGNGTLWLDNVEEGDRFVVGGSTYRVKRVDSNTQIILLNYSTITVASSTYSIEKDQRTGYQFYPSPDKAYVLPYSYYKRVFDMVNENKDRSELPEDFDIAIVDGAEASRMRDLDDPKWLQKQLEFTARIKDLRAKYMVHSPKLQTARPFIRSRR